MQHVITTQIETRSPAIQAHRVAFEAHGAAISAHGALEELEMRGKLPSDHPDLLAAADAVARACDEEEAAWGAVLRQRPSSQAQLLEKVQAIRNNQSCVGDPCEMRAALDALSDDIRSLMSPPPATPLAIAWSEARDAFYAADAANRAVPDGASDAVELEAHRAVWDALDRWESLPPPSLEALVEVWRASLTFDGRDLEIQSVDDVRTLRDFLDGGDKFECMAARYLQHAMRLVGMHDAEWLATPPITGLYEPFEAPDCVGGIRAAYEQHHANRELRDGVEGELKWWWAAVAKDPTFRENLRWVVGKDNTRAYFEAVWPPEGLDDRRSDGLAALSIAAE